MDLDPDFTCSFVIRGKIRQSVDPYRQLLQEKKADARQSKMEDFFTATPPSPRRSSPMTRFRGFKEGEEEVEELGL